MESIQADNPTRPLAVVGRIEKIEAIEGADRIRSATVNCGESGTWTGVVSLDYQEDDLVTVFLQDAILPVDQRWAFMEKSKWRVRIARFKGSPSECLIITLGDLQANAVVGSDRTAELGVVKYEKKIPESMNGVARGSFPTFIPKTDEENFQRARKLVDRMQEGWVATIKYDGTSCTAFVDESTGNLRVCSRNLELEELTPTGQGNAYWRTARLYKLENLPPGIAIQFEVVGVGIQQNPGGFPSVCGFAFKAYDIRSHKYLTRIEFDYLCKSVGIPVAKIVASGNLILSSDGLRKLASEQVYPNGKAAEGIVISAEDGSWSFKVINPDYKEAK